MKKIDNNFICGLIDADGNFYIRISIINNRISIQSNFNMVAYNCASNLALFMLIKETLGVGRIYIDSRNYLRFVVNSLDENIKIMKFINEHKLFTNKQIYFQLQSKILHLMIEKEHLTEEGILKILYYKKLFKYGLNDKFSHINIPELNIDFIEKPSFLNISPYQLAGFVEGDGSFSFSYEKSKSFKTTFGISQTIINSDLFYFIKKFFFFDTGIINTYKDKYIYYKISDKSSIINNVIPFFNKYQLIGEKYDNYLNFNEAIEIYKKNLHKTDKGLERLKYLMENSNSKKRKK